jgi:MgtC family
VSWQQIQPFLVALAVGLLLGLERERSHSRKLPAGSRSFALLSLVGAVTASFGEWAVVVGLVGVGALLALAYFRTSEEDPGTTTAIAALVAYLLGALAYTRAALAVYGHAAGCRATPCTRCTSPSRPCSRRPAMTT